jgi:integrase/recombinase XerD
MYSTGCRIGEVVNLDKHSINSAEQSVIVFGKGKKEREVYFNTRCSIWLKRYLEERTDDQQALFVTSTTSNEYCSDEICNKTGFQKSWNK